MSSTGAGLPPHGAAHTRTHTLTHIDNTHTHTRKGTGQWARAYASQDHESDQLSRTHQPLGHSCSPSLRSQNTQRGPPAHLPSGVLLVNIVDHLIRQRWEMQAAPGTGQHQQATEGGQELPHFENWIGDSPGEERTQDISMFLPSVQVLDTHKASPQDALFWGPHPILSPPSAPRAPWFPLPEPGCRQSACRDLGTCGLSCLVSEPQPVLTAHRTARWTECVPCPQTQVATLPQKVMVSGGGAFGGMVRS